MQLQFRFKPEQAYDDVDPARIESAIRQVSDVERWKIFDDRLSDATFVTLVVVLRSATVDALQSLHAALTSIPRARTFAVNQSGAVTQLRDLPPDRLPQAAASEVDI